MAVSGSNECAGRHKSIIRALLIAVLCLCPAVFAQMGDDDDDDDDYAILIRPVRPSGRPQLAVYTTGHADSSINRAFSFGVLYMLVRTGRFAPVARYENFLAAASKNPAASSDDQARSLAGQVGAQFVCLVNMTQALENYHVSARVINVETGEIVAIGAVNNPLSNKTDIMTATVATVNNSLRMTYLAGVDADELDNDYRAEKPLPPFVFEPAPTRTRPVYKSFDDAVERMFGGEIYDSDDQEQPDDWTAASVMADGRERFTETTPPPPAPPAPPPPPPVQQRIDVSQQSATDKSTKTRLGIRTGYNASKANVSIFSSTGRTTESDFGSGWELGLVTSTGSSHWFFNSGASLIFRKPVKSSNLHITETALAVPALMRLAGGNDAAIGFLDLGLQFDFAFSTKDDHNKTLADRSKANIGFVLGGGFGIGQHVEIDGKAIWGLNDFADIPMQRGNKLFQFTTGFTYMFKERAQ